LPEAPTTSLGKALVQPRQLPKNAPCSAGCASGVDVRGWISVVAQRRKLGLTDAQAFAKAWRLITEANPFPATLGRICPHPCEDGCNRSEKEAAVSVNALERFLGDWALERKLKLPAAERGDWTESVGVIGSGPAGLSFAYQMARRGYRVTVYEKRDRPGGMLSFGVPEFRLPDAVLQAEIRRILDVGVVLALDTPIGRGVTLQELRDRHDVVFIGIGAGAGRKLGIPGEEGGGVWTGTGFLDAVNRGESVALGGDVVVVGGGNSAVDAARMARRAGANVTLLYRRTRDEMPAIASEVDEALEEGIAINFLTAPLEVTRSEGLVRSVRVQRMTLGEPDATGRRRPIPVSGDEREIPASAVIAAVSQEPDWEGLDELRAGQIWIRAEGRGALGDGLWAGGDALGLGIAGFAIAQGRQAAEAVHAQLRRRPAPSLAADDPEAKAKAKPGHYTPAARWAPSRPPVAELLAQPDMEVTRTMSEESFLDEVSRCFSCGSCFGCQQCFMFCNAKGFLKVQEVAPGRYYTVVLDQCESCGKCIEVCPCGYLSAKQA
jgi:NADPH-dependent glutamate synthase beta subunit-like oxidoreductase/ferredoxin